MAENGGGRLDVARGQCPRAPHSMRRHPTPALTGCTIVDAEMAIPRCCDQRLGRACAALAEMEIIAGDQIAERQAVDQHLGG